ncbi:MAG TPA: hypothetical protein VFJ94_10770 [Intrasporangium sp.]|uniref:hypothetical protein n=1 Tax=Intrasporangium sp. TaxID=1925024 RepID=UPI002D7741D1|nr:hypothetical protein [Intrasporangium sp.]HET7398993.1 hypothetical protein [Intrasporangium sp.]
MDLEQRTQAVLMLLRGQPGLDVFDGEPDARMDSDGRAHPYAALYVSPGRRDPNEDAVTTGSDLLAWTFQVTAAGGDVPRARRAVTRVLAALDGARISTAGGPIALAADPGPILTDRTVAPYRSYAPLLFAVQLAAE